jgi:hypothetical protein
LFADDEIQAEKITEALIYNTSVLKIYYMKHAGLRMHHTPFSLHHNINYVLLILALKAVHPSLIYSYKLHFAAWETLATVFKVNTSLNALKISMCG